jgi:hypothetical protein
VRLAFDQRQLPHVVAGEIGQVERDHDDLRGALEHGKVGGAVRRGTTISPSMIAEPALLCQGSAATSLKRFVGSVSIDGDRRCVRESRAVASTIQAGAR